MNNNQARENLINLVKTLDVRAFQDEYDVSTLIRQKNIFGVHAFGGASKVCLVVDSFPYVVKWVSNNHSFDEAEDEARIYKEACERGFERMFPKTEFLFSMNGLHFYIQEKVDFSVSRARDLPIWNSKYYNIGKTVPAKIVHKIQKCINQAGNDCHREISLTWAKMLVSLYGKHFCKEFCKFLIEKQINDLHEANIGFKNDRPVILDFSGYHRSSYYSSSSF